MESTAELCARVADHPLMSLGYGVATPSAEALYNEAQALVQEAQDELLHPDNPLLLGFVEETTLGEPIEFQPKAVDQIMGLAQYEPMALVEATRLELNLVDESTNLTVPLGAAAVLASPGIKLLDLLQQGPAACDRTLYTLHQSFQSIADGTRNYVLEQGTAILAGLQQAIAQYDSATGSMTLPPIVVNPTVAALVGARSFDEYPQRTLSAVMQEVVDAPKLSALPFYGSTDGTFKLSGFALASDYVPDAYTLEDIVISPEDFHLEMKSRTELNLVLPRSHELILGGQALNFISNENLAELLAGLDLDALSAELALRQACSAALALTDTYMEFNALCQGLRALSPSELTEVLKAPPPPPKPEKPENNGADLAALELAISLAKTKAAHGKMPSQAELDKVLAALRRH